MSKPMEDNDVKGKTYIVVKPADYIKSFEGRIVVGTKKISLGIEAYIIGDAIYGYGNAYPFYATEVRPISLTPLEKLIFQI